MQNTIPPYLKKGNCIGITCPAGYMPAERAQTCIRTLQKWGFEVMVGKTLGSDSNNYFSATEEQRRDELQAMLDDDSIHAILCGRGGYGLSPLLDQLDFKRFKKKPKWIIGFSDITALHVHLNRRLHIASLHAPMAAAFNNGGSESAYIQSLHRLLTGKKTIISGPVHPFNNKGKATAELVGGNLTLITHLIGTKSQLQTNGKILFLEDIGEYIYATDRMLVQIKRSGLLNNLAGLIIGGFTDYKDTERPFGKTITEAIHAQIGKVDFPVCFDFPISHSAENYAVKSGCIYELNVGKTVTLKSK
jgi:muramoyltetrapeptide carboxypeptidase